MFHLKSLVIKDFLSFKEATIDFSKPGLYFISGFNDKNGDSNGSGKSSIVSAICWALFNKTTKGLTGQDVVRWGTDSCYVKLEVTDGKTDYIIERGPRNLAFSIGGVSQLGNKTDVQRIIESTFRSDYFTFVRSTAFSQGQVQFLGASTDTSKKELFKGILNLDKIDEAYKKAGKNHDTLDLEYGDIERRLATIKSEIQKGIERASTYRKAQDEFDEAKALKIKGLEDGRDTSITGSPPSGVVKQNIKNQVTVLESQCGPTITEANERIAMVSADRAVLMNQHDNMFNLMQGKGPIEDCSQCVPLQQGKAAMQSQLDSWKRMINKYDRELKSQRDRIAKATEMTNTLFSLQQQLKSIEMEELKYEMDVKSSQERIQSINKQIADEQAKVSPYDKLLLQQQEDLQQMGNSQQMLEARKVQVAKDIDLFSYLKWVFSKAGVVSFIIEKAFGRLQFLANMYLSKITSERLSLEIAPQKELKSGAFREEIEIVIKMDDQKVNYWGLSDGQRARINAVMLFAIRRWALDLGVNAFDFLLLDEVLDISIDKSGQEDLLDLLKDMKKEIGTIVVISHQDVFKSSFDHEIFVRRDKDGISRIV
jgi:DNA repair exonuclease SbcCD ATPase subunit